MWVRDSKTGEIDSTIEYKRFENDISIKNQINLCRLCQFDENLNQVFEIRRADFLHICDVKFNTIFHIDYSN